MSEMFYYEIDEWMDRYMDIWIYRQIVNRWKFDRYMKYLLKFVFYVKIVKALNYRNLIN